MERRRRRQRPLKRGRASAPVVGLRPAARLQRVDQDTDEEVTYQIVGDDEADIKKGLISVSSPIARALVGKMEGDEAVVNAPGGQRVFEIIEVRYE